MSAGAKPPKPADRMLGFAQAAQKQINGALARCEERHPQEGPNSVLYVVLERDTARYRKQLNTVFSDYFGSLASVQLEVVDRATHEAVERLVDAGLVARTMRAARSLWPEDDSTISPPPLSEVEREKARAYRSDAARKLRAASALADADLNEEARTALLSAIEPLGLALAVENRLPEPQSLEDALLPAMGTAWKNALPLVRSFLRESSLPVSQVVFALGQV
ncbi:MAG TPA: hypothetical protein VGN61_02025 [Verrucomicrobiae bacterium]